MTPFMSRDTQFQRNAFAFGRVLALTLATVVLLGVSRDASADRNRTVRNDTRTSVNKNTNEPLAKLSAVTSPSVVVGA
jgi:hypothetical protein